MPGRVICEICRHPRPLHKNGTSACKARGCHAGPNETPCPGFQGEVVTTVAMPRFMAANAEPLPVASGQ
jgi:hypothetical protein